MTKARILIVDDQEEILNSLGGALADEGYELLKARDGQEALHIVQSDSPDIVFLDIWIPGIDGMQTLKAIKKVDPDCAVVMMSGHGAIETAVKAIKMGALDYLEKPLNLEDVLHLIETTAARKSAVIDKPTGAHAIDKLMGTSEKTEALRRSILRAASEKDNVLLVGPKGTGKEFLARIIHNLEGKDKDFLVKVRCADLTEDAIADLFVSRRTRLFGTGVRGKKPGSLLLVGTDKLHPDAITRLERILTESRKNPALFPRIISTALRDPEHWGASESARRLSKILAERIIHVPSLRERSLDIPAFALRFLAEAAEEFEKPITGIDETAMEKLIAYDWPGNVRELKILIEHMVMTSAGPTITVHDLFSPLQGASVTESLGASSRSIGATMPEPAIPIDPSGGVRYQKTLRTKAVIYGQGLHSGAKTGLTLMPLPTSTGILFGHITSPETISAHLVNVQSTEFSTSLRRNGSLARTIEHLMAAFHMYGLTNVLVKISGEVPIMDGSALQFCELIESADIIVQDEPIKEIVITEPLELPMASGVAKSMRIEPSDTFEVEYFMDYPKPIGKMNMHFRSSGPEFFKREIAPARTFGFVRDMRMMDEMGLAGGGRLSNVVLLDEEKVVNPPLRFPDEFVRHKILDVIGDFYLLGRPIRGKVTASQTGHTENIAMMKLISERFTE